MIPGPTLIRKCSECGQHLAQFTSLSGNTFGATYWTDGKVKAPGLPDRPRLVICPHCNAPVWLKALELVKEVEPFEDLHKENAERPREPMFDEYVKIIQAVELDKDKAFYVRMRAWWAGNDGRRHSKDESSLSVAERDNLEQFLLIVPGDSARDRLMKAEMLRELGKFDEAGALLDGDFGSDLSQAHAFIAELVEQRDAKVGKFLFS